MENQNVEKERQRHFDRITLDAKTLELIDSWMEQVKLFKPGVELSRKDILNWLVQNSWPAKLSTAQKKGLAAKFFSELRFVQYAARRIKEAHARGEVLTLKDLEAAAVETKEPLVKKARKLKGKNQNENTDEPSKTSDVLDSSA